MVKDVKALGYLYAPPASPDALVLEKVKITPTPKGGLPLSVVNLKPMLGISDKDKVKEDIKTPYIVFTDVVCTTESYTIDIFLKNAKSQSADPISNPDFVGRLFRFGMGTPPDAAKATAGKKGTNDASTPKTCPAKPSTGVEKGKNLDRCSKPTVTRTVNAEKVRNKIEGGWVQVVTEAGSGRVVPEDEWKGWKGFVGRLIWTST
jgi:hypothetical protein